MSYQVRSGDTLSAIAKRYGVSLAALEHANPQLHDPNNIYVGERLAIPGQKDHFQAAKHAPKAKASAKPKATHAGPVKRLESDIAKLQKALAAEHKAQHQVSVDLAKGKAGQADIEKQKQQLEAQLTDPSGLPDQATTEKLLQELMALGQRSARLQDQTTRAVAADKKAIQADAKLAKADKQRALKELLPAEYKLGLARTNKDRKALGLKAVKKAIRPKGPVAPKGFKALTPAQFKAIAPHLGANAKVYAKYLNEAMIRYHITTPRREAAFIAQITEETDGMNTLTEYASGREYEGRRDLGNTHPGDGPRFKGRGAIQLTGRFNYIKYGREMGIDLVDHPARAANPSVAFLIAGQYWADHGLNRLADRGDFVGITRAINGGTNGLGTREFYWAKARRILGAR